jgi:hypothetical protein
MGDTICGCTEIICALDPAGWVHWICDTCGIDYTEVEE